jgi:hypothetical protein
LAPFVDVLDFRETVLWSISSSSSSICESETVVATDWIDAREALDDRDAFPRPFLVGLFSAGRAKTKKEQSGERR